MLKSTSILPLFGLQFRLLSLFGGATPVVAVIFAILGAVLIFADYKGRV